MSPRLRQHRMPLSEAALATSSISKYMSQKQVVPVEAISMTAPLVPQ